MSIAATGVAGDDPVLSWPTRIRRWELWRVPRAGRALVLVTELVAVVAVAASIARTDPTSTDLGRAGLLAGLAIIYSEAARRIERVRDYLHLAGPNHIGTTPTSVWTLPAALVLPAGYAAAVIAVIDGHLLLLGCRQKAVRPHRVVFGTAAAIAGAFAVAGVHHWHGASLLAGGPTVAATAVAALLAYTCASLVVVVVGVRLLTGAPWRGLLPARGDLAFEAATLVLGLLAAEVITRLAWITPAIYILVTMLHRSTMVSELEHAASTDVKTGLLNHRGWQQVAGPRLLHAARTGRPAAVVVLDLDHFKHINDTYGHPAGDTVLAAVAGCLRSELRGYDAVARYGGEEFVAYLDDLDATAALGVAERLRQAIGAVRVGGMTVTASLGVAAYPVDAATLDGLIGAADTALYAAKRAGRDRVAGCRSAAVV